MLKDFVVHYSLNVSNSSRPSINLFHFNVDHNVKWHRLTRRCLWSKARNFTQRWRVRLTECNMCMCSPTQLTNTWSVQHVATCGTIFVENINTLNSGSTSCCQANVILVPNQNESVSSSRFDFSSVQWSLSTWYLHRSTAVESWIVPRMNHFHLLTRPPQKEHFPSPLQLQHDKMCVGQDVVSILATHHTSDLDDGAIGDPACQRQYGNTDTTPHYIANWFRFLRALTHCHNLGPSTRQKRTDFLCNCWGVIRSSQTKKATIFRKLDCFRRANSSSRKSSILSKSSLRFST